MIDIAVTGLPYPDYTGSFSFSVDMTSGAITGATMSGSSNRNGNGTVSHNLSGGSGTMTNGNFHIDGYGGTVISGASTFTQPTTDTGTYMDGSGNIDNVGGGVSGTYEVSGAAGTGWGIDGGSFSGTRTR